MAGRNEDLTRGDESLHVIVEQTEVVHTEVTAEADAADPGAIRAEIRETRERVGETLEAIGERLNPSNIREQVKDNIRDATIGRVQDMAHSAADRVNDARYTIADTIRENPIPAAMIGIGLGWLFMNSRRGQESSGGYGGASRERYDARYNVRYAGEPRAYAGAPYGSDQRTSGGDDRGALDRARERAGDLGHDVRDAAGSIADRAQDAASAVADRTSDAASSVAGQARRQARRVEDHFYENPLAIGAVTAAFGIAAGLAIPVTEREVQLMGDARDELVDRAREVAQDATTRVQHVAERVIDEARTTAQDAARDEGLAAG